MVNPPTSYPNSRNDDPWDNDAVSYLLTKPDVARVWKKGPLFECLRRQPGWIQKQPARVEDAARAAKRHGVEQLAMHDPRVGKDIVRLIRTDAAAPLYPRSDGCTDGVRQRCRTPIAHWRHV